MSSERQKDPWRTRFQEGLVLVLGEERAASALPLRVDEGMDFTTDENVSWTRERLRRLQEVASDREVETVLAACAHHLPESVIAVMRHFARKHATVEELLEFWRSEFLHDLRLRYPDLGEERLSAVIEEGWGQAGTRAEGGVLVTKIPKDLPGFFEAQDDAERAYRYCHCDRIRESFLTGRRDIPAIYCHCGAGFYREGWGRVLGREVGVRVERSLLMGDPVCQFRILLP